MIGGILFVFLIIGVLIGVFTVVGCILWFFETPIGEKLANIILYLIFHLIFVELPVVALFFFGVWVGDNFAGGIFIGLGIIWLIIGLLISFSNDSN